MGIGFCIRNGRGGEFWFCFCRGGEVRGRKEGEGWEKGFRDAGLTFFVGRMVQFEAR